MTSSIKPQLIVSLFLLAILFILSLTSKINDPFFSIGIILSFVIFIKLKSAVLRLTCIDTLIVILLLYEIILQFISVNFITNFIHLKISVICTLYYLVLRLCFNKKVEFEYLLFSYGLIIGVAALLGCVAFFYFEDLIYNIAQFDSLYPFRYLYKPLGQSINIWSSYLLGFAGLILFSILYCRKLLRLRIILIFCLIPVTYGIITSFSRGIYVAFIFLLISLFLLLVFSKTKLITKLCLSCCVAICLLLIIRPFVSEVFQTLNFTETISQQKSIEGRVLSSKASFKKINENLFFGAGSGTFSQIINTKRYESDKTSFTTFAPHIISQLLIEKGIIGFSLWLLFLIVIFVYLLKRIHLNLIFPLFLIISVTILIRELSFPVLLNSMSLKLVMFTLLAAVQNIDAKNTFIINKDITKWISIIPFIICLGILSISLSLSNSNKLNDKAVKLAEGGNIDSALKILKDCDDFMPTFINKGYMYWKQYYEMNDTVNLNIAIKYFRCVTNYYRSPLLDHNIAYMIYERGNTIVAINRLKTLVEEFPENALYNLSLSRILYLNKNNNKWTDYLIKAVKYNPSVLNSCYWKEIDNADPYVKDILIESLINSAEREQNPIIISNIGKSLYLLDRKSEAEKFISKALEMMPNLPKAWLNLALVEFDKNNKLNYELYATRYLVLSGQSQLKSLQDDKQKMLMQYKDELKIQDFGVQNYISKYIGWYMSNLFVFTPY
ncbi:MAG: O-antigen ligase family protein [Bacteroidales bacterium]|nr:O-antigen ligase family protein [Bacteroidales bacterium]